MPIVESLLVAVLKGVLENLLAPAVMKYARRERIHKVLMKWTTMLKEIEAVLADAEDKLMRLDHKGIQLWLDDLEDLAYDLDDILDEFATEVLRQTVMAEPQASTSRVRALMPTCCTSFSPRSLVSDYRIRSKIDEITTRLQDLFDRGTGLGLQKVMGGPSAKAPQRPPSTSLIYEPCFYGREEDKKAITELLLSDQSGNSNVGVVPIVGMGGVGKTALAQMVYNDERVEKHFEKKVWVCVSEEFDIMGITKAILESVTSRTCEFKALEQVQVELKQALAGKKFLIVLDDVWNKNHGDWSRLKSPFNDGAPGSKVMVTTRNRDVALIMAGTNKYHYLKQLSEDDCWSVFVQHAFENGSTDASPNLVSLGKKIVEKCRGLPLAARTLGGLLRCKLGDDEWEDVLNSNIWEISNEESDILPALRLSYYHLPSLLNKCFAYCSILPKDYEFEEEELVLLWMAEGFIQQPSGAKQMEDLGREYFRELLSRSFLQLSSGGESTLFVMHDLINDLAQFVARKFCFRLEDKFREKEQYKDINKARHSSYTREYIDSIKKFEAFREAKNLRTFLPLVSRDPHGYSYLTRNVTLNLLPNLKRLRVLSLRRYKICELLSSIGDLKHVRYLDLSNALVTRLPDSVSTLYNLQTLILRNCQNLEKLPTNTGDLVNLRHLDVTGADSLQEMPPKIGKLTSLQTLSNFIVSKDKGSTIRELGNLIHLRGRLSISGLEHVVDVVDARGANLNGIKGLNLLVMKWNNHSSDPREESVESEVLDVLKPHKNLKEFKIIGYHGLSFPTWVGSSFFSNMVSLVFENCEKCTTLPPLGQLPSLAKLYISGMKAVENVGLEFFGLGCSCPFSSLEVLTFEDMPEWKEWWPFGADEKAEVFVRLSELSIKRCPKLLRKLPNKLPFLKKLEIEECPQLVVELLTGPMELHEKRSSLQFESLNSLSLKDVKFPDSFGEVGDEAVLEDSRYNHWGSLTFLKIENIEELACLPSWFVQGLTGLQELIILDCSELRVLWQNEVRLQHRLPGLRRLKIYRCPQLISLFEEGEEEEKEGQHEGLLDITLLEYLEIESCEKLEELPRGLHNLKSLQKLFIRNCPRLISFSKTGFPSSLKYLDVHHCGALQALPEFIKPNNRKALVGQSSGSGLPSNLGEQQIECPSLEYISILDCESLKSFPDLMQDNDLRNLSGLRIFGCHNLESIPEGWFRQTNLRVLMISGCEKLEAVLPHHACNDTNNYLASLTQLGISSCPAATRLASYYILKGGSSSFTNLTRLVLRNVDIGKPPSEWGLHRLSSLTHLIFSDYGWTSFPEDGVMLLPTSLTFLSFTNLPNLEKLPCKDFADLASLHTIDFENCPMLTSISEVGLLPSLLKLYVHDSPKLASFPEQGLPPSLQYLSISGCPMLSQRCKKGNGKYWRSISHIPEVCIDHIFHFDPRN